MSLIDRTANPDVRFISNSETGAWNMCKNNYRYAYDLNLAPIRHSDPLSRGILGHDAIAEWYKVIANGGSLERAKSESDQILSTAMRNTVSYAMEIVLDVKKLLEVYYARTQGDIPYWQVLEVESRHDLPLNDMYAMPLRLDLLVRDRRTGVNILVDHKFTYDFWSEDDLALSPQFPKYLGALRNNGYVIDHTILNQIRTRHLKSPGPDDLLRRTTQRPSNAKIRNALREHVVTSQEITNYRKLPDAVRPQVAVGVRNKMVCRSCNFRNLCASEYDGGDITYLIQNDYKANAYAEGYNPTTPPSIEELM